MRRKLKELNRRYNALVKVIKRYETPMELFVPRYEVERLIMQLRSYIGEVESKVSNKWYNHVGLIEKLEYLFTEPIRNNTEAIKRLERDIKELYDAL